MDQEDLPSQKHIDFDGVLISVRRLDDQHTSPSHSSQSSDEEKSRMPGTDPSLWQQKPGTLKNESAHFTMRSPRLSPCHSSSLPHTIKPVNEEPEILPARIGRITLASLLKSTAHFEHVVTSLPLKSNDSCSDVPETMASTEGITATCHVSVDGVDGGRLISQTSMTSRDFIMHRFLPAAKTRALDTSKICRRRSAEVLKPIIGSSMFGGFISPTSSMKERTFLAEKDEYRAHCGYAMACGLFSMRLGNLIFPWSRTSVNSGTKLDSDAYKAIIKSSKQIQAASRIRLSFASRDATDHVATDVSHTELILDEDEISDKQNSQKCDTMICKNNLESKLDRIPRGRIEVDEASNHGKIADKVNLTAKANHHSWRTIIISSNLKKKVADIFRVANYKQGRMSFSQRKTETNLLPPRMVANSSIQRNLSRRSDHILSPPLPQSPSESWLYKALQQKPSSSTLAWKQLLPKSPKQS